MHIRVDLHVHSKYARAVSKYMELPAMATAAAQKGIQVIATGDWQHPAWFQSINDELEEISSGLFKLKKGTAAQQSVRFMLVTEVSCMYRQGAKYRRVHHLIFSPSLDACTKVIAALQDHGSDLLIDGRPNVWLSSRDLVALLLDIDPNIMLLPAHVWTPWFGLFGSKTGFDSLQECFGDMTPHIYAIETGLSSDPLMNWRVGQLDELSIVSFSDAHSAAKLGRELTVVEVDTPDYTYESIIGAIKQTSATSRVYETVEFFPEEGKYHWTGHRACGVRYSPEEERAKGIRCPVCGKPLTSGVEHRVDELAGTAINPEIEVYTDEVGLQHSTIIGKHRPSYVSMVPLLEIIQNVIVSPTKSAREYDRIVSLRPEFDVLLTLPVNELMALTGEPIAHAIERVRRREIHVEPGYDGVFGSIEIH